MGETLSKDEAFHLLQNPRRRAVMRYLLAHPDRAEFRMDEVIEAIAAWENGTTVQQLDRSQRDRIHISLYQTHLPKLDDHDVIDFEEHRGIIRPAPSIEVLSPFLGDGLRDADTHVRIRKNGSETSLFPRLVERLFAE